MVANVDRVYLSPVKPPGPDERTWWDRYSAQLGSLSDTSRLALEEDSRYVLDKGILSAGQPDAATWPASRSRSGLVMGSVQSGKTASMLGVSAMALDAGIDLLIVLAGTRLSLWRQTYERLTEQLDAGLEDASKASRRILRPRAGVGMGDTALSVSDTYKLSSAQVRRQLKLRRPIILVAMKQTNHLQALGASLRDSFFEPANDVGRPVHMLVLDDEADDGSVLDAAVEAGQDPVFGNLKQIPRAIADLWDPRSAATPPNIYSTYVGYTATPQANILQADHNPLAPRDFVISLRTPLDIGKPIDLSRPSSVRSTSYPEPAGLDRFYTGGEVFYKRANKAKLCVALEEDADALPDAVRAFLVAGAIKLWRGQDGTPGPKSLQLRQFESPADASEVSPAPHSMLIHPSSGIEDHFQTAEDVLLWATYGHTKVSKEDRESVRLALEGGSAFLPVNLGHRLLQEEDQWAPWVDHYAASQAALAVEFNVLHPRGMPTWSQIRDLLVDEVIPGTRVSVVNSSPSADDRPRYKPVFDEGSSSWKSAPDLSTIFVAGNVMARGLTLEGLTTSLFRRGSSVPLADTQMQMQRWFGYRGKELELCRLFATKKQLDLFRSYHEIDEAIRVVVSQAMGDGAPLPTMLHGAQFLATGKIANLARKPLGPGGRPFISMPNMGDEPDPNVQFVSDLFSKLPSADVSAGGVVRGRYLEDMLSMNETAELLDRLVFPNYQPGDDNQIGELWRQMQSRVAAISPLDNVGTLYRPPKPLSGAPSPVLQDCPYTIPAYLRLWSACLSRSVRGLFVTGTSAEVWSMANLSAKATYQPKFTVGIRFGGGSSVATGPLSALKFPVSTTEKRVGDTGRLETRWGSNDPSATADEYRGDVYFDYYARGIDVPVGPNDTYWRPEGAPGQILFYINQVPGQTHPVVSLGICIPAGGPEQFAALRLDHAFSD